MPKISTYNRQSPTDAPGMKGDRSRTKDGTLRQVRSDEQLRNNPTIKERAPELVDLFPSEFTVGDLRNVFKGLDLSDIAALPREFRLGVCQGARPSLTQQIAALRSR